MVAEQGKLVILSGPSGAGKTTIAHGLFARCRQLCQSVSATTRSPRPGEIDGKDYHFLSPEEFARRREAGEFLESFEVFGRGYWYGTLKSEVTPRLAAGQWVLLEIDVDGALEVLRSYPEAVTIFVAPETIEELERRLQARGTETAEAIERRLEVARRELTFANRYRYRVTNDKVDDAIEQIVEILGCH
jgi:guanylate kinase